MKPPHVVAIMALVLAAACTAQQTSQATSDAAPGTPGMAPRFEVDPLWPKPLPNHWILGSTIGVSVDSRDHVWIVHRGDQP